MLGLINKVLRIVLNLSRNDRCVSHTTSCAPSLFPCSFAPGASPPPAAPAMLSASLGILQLEKPSIDDDGVHFGVNISLQPHIPVGCKRREIDPPSNGK